MIDVLSCFFFHLTKLLFLPLYLLMFLVQELSYAIGRALQKSGNILVKKYHEEK